MFTVEQTHRFAPTQNLLNSIYSYPLINKPMNISLSIDDETRKKASLRAKKDKLSFSAVIRILLSDYAEGKIVIGTRSVACPDSLEMPVDKKM